MTRGYHGEHIKERQWEKMFSRRLLSVVNMNPRYMAAHDGSEQATGRGSGHDKPGEEDLAEIGVQEEQRGPRPTNMSSDRRTPYMNMAYAPMERRLDIAVWRSLFASSARQARQFVVHGAVKVNGQEVSNHFVIIWACKLEANRRFTDAISRIPPQPRRHVPGRCRAS